MKEYGMNEIIVNALPPRFKTWCQMYRYMQGRILPDIKEIRYADYGSTTVWEFSLDFIKARCFEEVLKLYPKENNTDYAPNDWLYERYNLIKTFAIKTGLDD